MRFFLISDNIDTVMGMRLAGIEGVVVHEVDEVSFAMKQAVSEPDIGVVLVTERLVKLCGDLFYDIKLKQKVPLVVEIPDRHAEGRTKDSITRYIREAIGLKM